MSSETPIALLLSDDLMFTSRITGTGRDLGLTIRPARSVEILQRQAAEQPVACVILDLANPSLNIPDLIAWFRQQPSPSPRFVAYGSHVDAAGLRAAKEAGCDVVLPRSKFVEELPRELPAWCEARRTAT